MEYIAYFTVIIVTFSLCFLVDNLFKRRKKRQGNPNRVKPQKRTASFGIVLAVFGVAVLFNFSSVPLLIACGVILTLLGLFMIVQYCGTAIVYQDDGFVYRTPLRGAKHYRYADIKGQVALMTRSGVNSTLLVGDDAIHLYQSMEGLNDFLATAYYGWLDAHGWTEEEHPAPNPTYFVWFAEP